VLTSKKTQSEIYIIHTNHPDVSVFVINDFLMFKDMNKQKAHFAGYLNNTFKVTKSLNQERRGEYLTFRQERLDPLSAKVSIRHQARRDTDLLLVLAEHPDKDSLGLI